MAGQYFEVPKRGFQETIFVCGRTGFADFPVEGPQIFQAAITQGRKACQRKRQTIAPAPCIGSVQFSSRSSGPARNGVAGFVFDDVSSGPDGREIRRRPASFGISDYRVGIDCADFPNGGIRADSVWVERRPMPKGAARNTFYDAGSCACVSCFPFIWE